MTASFPVNFDPFVAQLAKVDNAGQSGDDHDLYRVYGDMERYLQDHSPGFACQAGCIQCCTTRMPFVSSLEWATVLRFVITLPEATQARLIAHAEMLRPMAGPFEKARLAFFQSAGQAPGQSAQCPMLLDGQCAIYDARPLTCRMYGYVASEQDGRTIFLGSALATAHLQKVAPQGLQLPSAAPFVRRMQELNLAQGETTWAYLPQWIWTHASEGRFVAEPVAVPVFPAS